MAKQTTNSVDILRAYCEKRWEIQDEYFESCYKGLRNMTMWVWIILFVFSIANNFILIHDIGKLEHRVATIEQTWSE